MYSYRYSYVHILHTNIRFRGWRLSLSSDQKPWMPASCLSAFLSTENWRLKATLCQEMSGAIIFSMNRDSVRK